MGWVDSCKDNHHEACIGKALLLMQGDSHLVNGTYSPGSAVAVLFER